MNSPCDLCLWLLGFLGSRVPGEEVHPRNTVTWAVALIPLRAEKPEESTSLLVLTAVGKVHNYLKKLAKSFSVDVYFLLLSHLFHQL